VPPFARSDCFRTRCMDPSQVTRVSTGILEAEAHTCGRMKRKRETREGIPAERKKTLRMAHTAAECVVVPPIRTRRSQRLFWKRRRRSVWDETRRNLLLLLAGLLTATRGQLTRAPVSVAVPSVPPAPTLPPTSFPTVSQAPSVSAAPTDLPTVSPQPSTLPSSIPSPLPTISPRPTVSEAPTGEPTVTPSNSPSSAPSIARQLFVRQEYKQIYIIPTERFFEPEEIAAFNEIYTGYALSLPAAAERVNATCEIGAPSISACVPGVDACDTFPDGFLNDFQFACNWSSDLTEVGRFPSELETFINSDLAMVTDDLQAANIILTEALAARLILTQTPAPSSSMRPTASPSARPTISPPPSLRPSIAPSAFPTAVVSMAPSSLPPFTMPPSPPPLPADSNGLSVGAISGIVVVIGLAALAGLAFYYFRRRKKRREQRLPDAANQRREKYRPDPFDSVAALADDRTDSNFAPILQSESVVSNKSLLSVGESNIEDESEHETDGTKNLQDEFDLYKNPTLEKLRSGVEGNVSGFEGIMSAAVTNALMGVEEAQVDSAELTWGCGSKYTGAELEASALCEVDYWLRRNENASVEGKRAFMQDILNRVVASVRFGKLGADDASRTIHESAALLELPLANKLPMATVIISGMRKTVTSFDITKALREFGEIDVAAVASGQRGFGILRFRHLKSVDRAMNRYRKGEIVVQDVAVQMKALMPSGALESRA
jgi:LPXTG-motif cell wall-anchored protein